MHAVFSGAKIENSDQGKKNNTVCIKGDFESSNRAPKIVKKTIGEKFMLNIV